MIEQVLERLTELERRLGAIVRQGKILEVNYAKATAKAVSGEMITGWLPWLTHRAGENSTWFPPEVGEQILIISPGGSPEQGFILPGIYQNSLPAPSADENEVLIQFADGTFVKKSPGLVLIDSSVSGAKMHLNAGGDVDINSTNNILIKAAGNMTLDAAGITIKGPVTQTGGDITSDGVSVQTHTHTDTAGTAAGTTTGPN